MIYYELLKDGTIGRHTTDARIAKVTGLNLTTAAKIVYGYDGRCYFQDEVPAKPQELIDQEEIADLKAKLSASDYAVIKIAEGAAQPEEYAELISQRQEWRARINELEAALLADKEPQEPETPVEKPQEETEAPAANE